MKGSQLLLSLGILYVLDFFVWMYIGSCFFDKTTTTVFSVVILLIQTPFYVSCYYRLSNRFLIVYRKFQPRENHNLYTLDPYWDRHN